MLPMQGSAASAAVSLAWAIVQHSLCLGNVNKTATCSFHKVGKCKLGAQCRHAHTEDALHKTPMETPTYQQLGLASFKQQTHRERMQTSPASVDSTSNRRSLASSKAKKTLHLTSMSMDFDQHHLASMCMASNQHAQSMSMSMDFAGLYHHPTRLRSSENQAASMGMDNDRSEYLGQQDDE